MESSYRILTGKEECTMKKIVKRAAALLFVVALVMSMMVVPASADYKTKKINGGHKVRAIINTGEPTPGWSYWTMIIVQNTGNNAIDVWEPGHVFPNDKPIQPGRSFVMYVHGKNAKHTVKLQAVKGDTSVAVSTVDRGSVTIR